MLYLIKDIADSFISFIKDDPVRPNIPSCERVGANKDVFVSRNNHEVMAITCVCYQNTVAASESELFEFVINPSIAIFYTIWSYQPGAGRQLILDSVQYIKSSNEQIERFVTLSPKTEMARRFHLKNGAEVFRENKDTINYEYKQHP
jgi:hypothetical protein